ncbi:class I SAM-dependent methyltransferase [Natronococcus jeotgali]|uniref:tRNA(Phe) (4-demethylwyosine(37)-C(7)) aminocarboxypropyltransferase n=1 Tax=Natronococcus jeotgali DSM 18795 TaxID=1227498 RepID=L9XRK7_9EURY|nr:class I SAM-dependent methyltransferase family protein [Natronococcus jeotgali]ELY64026.1 hypothetical protein C492_05882 [Natronococcus jeotgali DSM 18795]
MPEGSDPDADTTAATDALERADAPLAAVVESERTETAIESLRAEGVYDDSRRVQAVSDVVSDHGERVDEALEGSRAVSETASAGDDATREDRPERIALPITEPPTDTRVLEVVRQLEPAFRSRDLEDLLAERGWSDAALEGAPGSWAVIGSIVLVTLPNECPDETDVAEALLELHGEADSVLADEGIANEGTAGTYREPRTRLLAGERDTETVHVEHGTRYGLDPAKVMFSPGNQAERVRMGEVVDPGERVFDMFAGIGYFALPMARTGARVTATELNPTAFRYLLENAVLNDVGDRIDAYTADCRELAGELEVDRVVMGYYGRADGAGSEDAADARTARTDEARDFLPHALEALVPGGVVHYHEATPESRLWDRPIERLETAAQRAERELEVLEKRRVKSHSAGVAHVVVDARFEE